MGLRRVSSPGEGKSSDRSYYSAMRPKGCRRTTDILTSITSDRSQSRSVACDWRRLYCAIGTDIAFILLKLYKIDALVSKPANEAEGEYLERAGVSCLRNRSHVWGRRWIHPAQLHKYRESHSNPSLLGLRDDCGSVGGRMVLASHCCKRLCRYDYHPVGEMVS